MPPVPESQRRDEVAQSDPLSAKPMDPRTEEVSQWQGHGARLTDTIPRPNPGAPLQGFARRPQGVSPPGRGSWRFAAVT